MSSCGRCEGADCGICPPSHDFFGCELAGAVSELRRANEKLEGLDRAKMAFFSNVSHEFRTPLTLILGPIENALAKASPLLDGEDLEAVQRNSVRLLHLVNDLLDFSRITAGGFELSYAPTDLAELTAGLAGAFQSLRPTWCSPT